MNAKEILYSSNNLNESEEVKRLYNKTHGLTDPGEQMNRNYNWNLDKANHVFGKPEPVEWDGAKKSLMSDNLEGAFPKTVIAEKRLEDFRQATSDMVGRGKFRGALHADIKDDHTFGVKSVLEGNWNVAKCLNGDPNLINEKSLEHDPDLGKNILHRSKLTNAQPKELDPHKTFGVPSIRYDLKQRTKPSVSDLTVKIFIL